MKHLILAIFIFSSVISYSADDSVLTYKADEVTITARKFEFGNIKFPSEINKLNSLMNTFSYQLIRKGTFFAQDVFVDGFKRGDINVVIDNERYHNACPNRMDSPLTRVNPLEMESVTFEKSGTDFQSNIAGSMKYTRSLPQKATNIKGSISTGLISSEEYDAALLYDIEDQRIMARFSSGNTYKNGDNKSFSDLYGYTSNVDYTLAEGVYSGIIDDFSYRTAFTFTKNVSFPYLQMDERENYVYSGNFKFMDYKLYFNYTDHVMDNALRTSSKMMKMYSAANNFTLGFSAKYYELFYRNWNINNNIKNEMVSVENNMIPSLNTFSAAYNNIYKISDFDLKVRLGATAEIIGNKDRMQFYESFYPEAESFRIFPIGGVSLSYLKHIRNNFNLGLTAETVSESPQAEQLFISVNKPMGKPSWSGNPALKQPIRSSLRAVSSFLDYFRFEISASYVNNYINLKKSMLNDVPFLTFSNINSFLYSVNFFINHEYLDLFAGYTYGQNITDSNPLSEIAPFNLVTTLKSPEFIGISGFIRHTYNDAQIRIDPLLNENTTSSWNKIDAGISFDAKSILINLEIENITNETYYRHLSYLRDPFSAGLNITEPGTMARIYIIYEMN